MPEIDRSQILIYSAIGLAVLVIGLVALGRGGGGRPAGSEEVARVGDGNGKPETFLSGAGRRRLVIDVAGAVDRPGVYRLPEGSRVIDAIRRAGGLASGASPGAINRAARLADGQQVVVPAAAAGGPEVGVTGEVPVSLGTATAAQLEEIDGIGPVTASRIIEFRDQQGGLSSVDDLDRVRGIGPVTLEALRSSLQP